MQWRRWDVLAIPTAAHSPARACRVLPRSIHIYKGEVTASHRICIPRYCRVLAAANDEMRWYYHRATPQSSYYFKKTGLVPEFDFFFFFGGLSGVAPQSSMNKNPYRIYIPVVYIILYSRVRLVCFSPTPSLPTSQFHITTIHCFFFLFFFSQGAGFVFSTFHCVDFLFFIIVLLLKLFYFYGGCYITRCALAVIHCASSCFLQFSVFTMILKHDRYSDFFSYPINVTCKL